MVLPRGGISLIAINTVFTVLATCAVALRFYAIRVIGRKYYLSDYFVVLGLIFTVATTIVVAAIGGAGLHATEATPAQLVALLKLFVAAPVVWSLATTFLKLSILSFYHKVFGSKKSMRVAVYIESVIVIALFIATILEPFLLCRPFRYTWDKFQTQGTCGDSKKAYLGVAVTNLVVDVSIYLLPIPVLWNLQMTKSKRLALCGIFALGLIVCIFSALRIYALLKLSVQDFSFSVINDANFGGLEVELGTINACLPFYRPLAAKYIPGLKSDRKPAAKTWENTARPSQYPGSGERGSRSSRGSQKPLHPHDPDPYGIKPVTPQAYSRENGNGPLDDSSLEKGLPDEQITVDRSINIFYSPT
ncbi:uncharacterized protein GIQ15_06288 [Arthroderma uncinatum]|uniref:uncharacterized protein n=1 Tax=Arthroderma uncinatum TaxID=74035 RepID=UPI00144A9914|nr:uncharacterized protein GIQ15_06288 [Arthroderma uncinatum]KAF3480941.1 hypothetical protein GIQ15_06288 [Arthroderma uncinatum]